MAAACMKNYQGACNYVKLTALKLLHLLLNSIHAYVTVCFRHSLASMDSHQKCLRMLHRNVS